MSRRMDYTVEFDAPAEKMYQDFTRREYWQTLMDAYRFLTPRSEITSFSSGERGTDITFAQNLPRMYLPPIARTVMPVDLIITRTQHFDPYDHDKNRAKGIYGASIPHPRQFRRPVLSHRDRRRQQVATRQCLQGLH